MSTSGLGEFLRSRRGEVSPAQAGLAAAGRRRVSGLRREEVATLADVSVDYYIRLEQGRERHPSPQVLDALADVLRLDEDGRLHLYRLAGLAPRASAAGTGEQVSAQLLELMQMWADTPALVLGRAYDVLAGNDLGYALFDGFGSGPNLLHKVFLDPDARRFYLDWDEAAANTVAGFRLLRGAAPGDPRIAAVLAEVGAASPDFRRLWERNEARGKRSEVKRFRHPVVGELVLAMEAFDVRSAPGQQLVVYRAEPGTPGAAALDRLRDQVRGVGRIKGAHPE
jgi:transcriptional regulator with XRE-family HTH domain